MRSAAATSMPQSVSSVRRAPDSSPRIAFSDQEERLLSLDLSDLAIPKMNDLTVDGMKKSWLSRLFGGR